MFTFSEQSNYIIPAHFGAWFSGQPQPGVYHDVTSLYVNYETEPALLSRFIPDGFTLKEPVVTVGYSMSRGIEWLAGGSYNLVQVSVPVVYGGDGERVEGMYVLVIWEDQTMPILAGREQQGMPKIFAEIEDHHQVGDHVISNASYDGWTFLRLDFRQGKPLGEGELAAMNRAGRVNAFGWRYVPNVGRPGAALSHATLFPQDTIAKEAWSGEGSVRWEALTLEQYPVHAPITQALAQLPVKKYRPGLMTHGEVVLRNDLARALPSRGTP